MDTILIVDDERSVLSSLKRSLVDEPYEILTASNGAEGIEVIKKHKIKLVISDERMPGMSGSEFLVAVKDIAPETVRIMLTGHASIEAAMRAINSGEIYRFFSKPWDDVQLRLAIRSALEKFNLEAENRRLLKTVRKQAGELSQLERKYPGITSLQKDEEGNVILEDIESSDKDIADIMSEIVSGPDSTK